MQTKKRSEYDMYYRELIQLSPCEACERLRELKTPTDSTCEAFPDKIPDMIISGRYDHRLPFVGDDMKLFKPYKKITLDKKEYLIGWNGVLEEVDNATEKG